MSLRIYDSGPQSSHELRGHTVKIGRTYEEIKSVIVRSFAALAKTEVQRGVDPRAATMDQQLMQARLDALKKLTQTDNPSVVQIPTLTATWASPNKSAGLFVLAIMKSLFEGAAVDAMETVVRDCFQDPDSFTTKMEKLSEEIAIQLCDQFMTEPVADQDTRKRGESPVLSRKKKKKAANVQQAQYKPYTIKPNKRQFRIGGEVRSLDPVDNTTKSLSLKNRRAHSWFNAILGYTPREEPPPVNHNTAVAAAKASFLREKDLTDYMSRVNLYLTYDEIEIKPKAGPGDNHILTNGSVALFLEFYGQRNARGANCRVDPNSDQKKFRTVFGKFAKLQQAITPTAFAETDNRFNTADSIHTSVLRTITRNKNEAKAAEGHDMTAGTWGAKMAVTDSVQRKQRETLLRLAAESPGTVHIHRLLAAHACESVSDAIGLRSQFVRDQVLGGTGIFYTKSLHQKEDKEHPVLQTVVGGLKYGDEQTGYLIRFKDEQLCPIFAKGLYLMIVFSVLETESPYVSDGNLNPDWRSVRLFPLDAGQQAEIIKEMQDLVGSGNRRANGNRVVCHASRKVWAAWAQDEAMDANACLRQFARSGMARMHTHYMNNPEWPLLEQRAGYKNDIQGPARAEVIPEQCGHDALLSASIFRFFFEGAELLERAADRLDEEGQSCVDHRSHARELRLYPRILLQDLPFLLQKSPALSDLLTRFPAALSFFGGDPFKLWSAHIIKEVKSIESERKALSLSESLQVSQASFPAILPLIKAVEELRVLVNTRLENPAPLQTGPATAQHMYRSSDDSTQIIMLNTLMQQLQLQSNALVTVQTTMTAVARDVQSLHNVSHTSSSPMTPLPSATHARGTSPGSETHSGGGGTGTQQAGTILLNKVQNITTTTVYTDFVNIHMNNDPIQYNKNDYYSHQAVARLVAAKKSNMLKFDTTLSESDALARAPSYVENLEPKRGTRNATARKSAIESALLKEELEYGVHLGKTIAYQAPPFVARASGKCRASKRPRVSNEGMTDDDVHED